MRNPSATTHPMRRLLSNRRGLLAGAAALVGAGLAKLGGPGRVEAGHDGSTPYSSESVVHVDVTNTTAGVTKIFRNTGVGVAFSVANTGGRAIFASIDIADTGILGRSNGGSPSAIGVDGQAGSTSGIGVRGTSGGSPSSPVVGGFGVLGDSTGSGAGVRALGNANAIGLWAEATGRVGIFGTSTGSTGIFGVTSASNPNGTAAPPAHAGVSGQGFGRLGVQGISDTTIGVQGVSTDSIGVYGISANYMGCGGSTQKAEYAGLFGYRGWRGATVSMAGPRPGRTNAAPVS